MDTRTSAMVDTVLGPLMVRRTGAGSPALLWHSMFVDSETFAGVTGDLGRSHELFLVDGPGHGGSPGVRRRYALQDCATAAAQIMDAVGITDPVDWVGNAWGGHVGILFADAYPTRCASLTTIGTPAYALPRGQRQKTSLLVYLYRILGPGPFTGAVVEALVGPDADKTAPEAASQVAAAFRRGNRQGKYWAMRSLMLGRPDLRPVLPRLRVPTLMMSGREDAMNDLQEAERAGRSVPDGSFLPVPGNGHVAPLLIAADQVTAAIQGFWSRAGNP
ncbi:alpha/beta fold hydrolase [Arthrobacter sp. zg-Y820]|uniref:alpha/beta fold hydrolase n=1 Tax=unclassified Arthrobacter TaxID=235627 RepID=UPI001E5E1599|nr:MULTISPECIES: alpha/beta fold hydrolase [unclassified Arthrobacter]MCC9197536.1 alpha/beta fold hydrolase [Arthrobacter sp. zg-Y820]MDK1280403.1 alpha/beta fold hydrolase [Arthrobacter sp. zg.Y820]MDK1360462.1 alpha/beta fold hydrolase [Arthrobacter sp. zg-Y1219]WIB09682.1 alpha/beta fold hydrolase [Arthrobacter sp. zg-Y820]